jgi:cystathionine beta-lyase/cystathionine gamma-synthase
LEEKQFSTRAVHAGERADLTNINSVVTPIFPSVGYTFADSNELDAVLGGEQPGYVYSPRYANPTVVALETAVANLEAAAAAIALPSGMAAIHLALLGAGRAGGQPRRRRRRCVRGDLLAGAGHLYRAGRDGASGGCAGFGRNRGDFGAGKRPLLVETISNPLMKVADLPRLAELAHAHGTQTAGGQHLLLPYLCNPIQFGADMVIHSATKFIGGHGDVMAGIVATSAELKAEMVRLNKLLGSSLGPFEAWLAHRGLKTLPLRMRQQCQNALEIATWLQNHPQISQVHYAFLPDHPQFDADAPAQRRQRGRRGALV